MGHHRARRWRSSPSSRTSGRIRARAEGRFEAEIAPLNGLDHDEGPREPNWDKIRSLPTLTEGGRLTAAVASQISDGSAALLIANEQAVKQPRPHAAGPDPPHVGARRRPDHDAVGADPGHPAGAGQDGHDGERHRPRRDQRGVRIRSCWPGSRETDFDHEQVNVNGGAIALGHPLGATGARLMTTLLHELERTGGRYGLQTMCEGGGQANVTIIERL